MAKILVEVDKNLDKDYPHKRGSIGEIILKDGRRFISSIDIAKGEPESPLTIEEIKEKFIFMTSDIIGKKVKGVCDLVMGLERVDDIRHLIRNLKALRRKK
jgi:2-methylcitrate dehydratase PrpD